MTRQPLPYGFNAQAAFIRDELKTLARMADNLDILEDVAVEEAERIVGDIRRTSLIVMTKVLARKKEKPWRKP